MSRRAQENVIAVLLLAVFAGVIWLSLDFGTRARMIPLPLAVLGIVLTLIQLVWQNVGSTEALQMEMIKIEAPVSASDVPEEPKRRITLLDELRALGIVLCLLALVFVVGLFPAVFVYTGAYFLLTRQYSWRASLLYTSALTVSVYLLFEVALQMQPYHGLLAPLIARFE